MRAHVVHTLDADDNDSMTYPRSAAIVAIALSSFFPLALPATAEETAPASTSAPADEYFGPLGLSVIGIRNDVAQTNGALAHVMLVEVSVHAWERRYPADVWLPRTVLALHRAYRRMSDPSAALHAVDTAAWLLQRYPLSAEARTLRAELAERLASADGDDTSADR
jgi:hypothetical protein